MKVAIYTKLLPDGYLKRISWLTKYNEDKEANHGYF